MRTIFAMLVAVAVILPGTAQAQNIVLGGDLVYGMMMDEASEDVTSMGLLLNGGYKLDFGLVPELQLGYQKLSHPDWEDVSASWMPIMVGARYMIPAGPVEAFAGAHVGISKLSFSQGDYSDSTSHTSINLGGGATYPINDNFGIGGVLWYWILMPDGDAPDGAENQTVLNIGLTATYTM